MIFDVRIARKRNCHSDEIADVWIDDHRIGVCKPVLKAMGRNRRWNLKLRVTPAPKHGKFEIKPYRTGRRVVSFRGSSTPLESYLLPLGRYNMRFLG